MATHKVTDADFGTLLQSDKPVLVDFWAAWCGPCQRMAPILEAVSEEYADRLIVGKLDVDENPQTAQRFGIQGIPTLLLFRGGEVVKEMVGYRPKAELVAQLTEVL